MLQAYAIWYYIGYISYLVWSSPHSVSPKSLDYALRRGITTLYQQWYCNRNSCARNLQAFHPLEPTSNTTAASRQVASISSSDLWCVNTPLFSSVFLYFPYSAISEILGWFFFLRSSIVFILLLTIYDNLQCRRHEPSSIIPLSRSIQLWSEWYLSRECVTYSQFSEIIFCIYYGSSKWKSLIRLFFKWWYYRFNANISFESFSLFYMSYCLLEADRP